MKKIIQRTASFLSALWLFAGPAPAGTCLQSAQTQSKEMEKQVSNIVINGAQQTNTNKPSKIVINNRSRGFEIKEGEFEIPNFGLQFIDNDTEITNELNIDKSAEIMNELNIDKSIDMDKIFKSSPVSTQKPPLSMQDSISIPVDLNARSSAIHKISSYKALERTIGINNLNIKLVSKKDGSNLFHAFSKNVDHKGLKTLLTTGPYIDEARQLVVQADDHQNPPIFYAFQNSEAPGKQIATARVLLEYGAEKDIDHQNDNGDGLLHFIAAKKGLHEFIKELVNQYNADIHMENNKNNTALHASVQCQQKENIDMLLLLGSNKNKKNTLKQTPLDIANGEIISLKNQLKELEKIENNKESNADHKKDTDIKTVKNKLKNAIEIVELLQK